MLRRPPTSTRTDTLFPSPTLFRSAMFGLRDRGHGSPFGQLVGSLVSARTRDETTVEICLRLFAVAHTPDQLAALDEATLADLLHGATFPEPKARDLRRSDESRVGKQWVRECSSRVAQYH